MAETTRGSWLYALIGILAGLSLWTATPAVGMGGWTTVDGKLYLPLDALADLSGITKPLEGGKMRWQCGAMTAEVTADSAEVVIDGSKVKLAERVLLKGGSWLVPTELAEKACLMLSRFGNDIWVAQHETPRALVLSQNTSKTRQAQLVSARVQSAGCAKEGEISLIPLRALAQYTGTKITPNGGQLVCKLGSTEFKLRIGSANIFLGGEISQLKAKTRLINEDTYVSLDLLDRIGLNYLSTGSGIVIYGRGATGWLIVSADSTTVRSYRLAYDMAAMENALLQAHLSHLDEKQRKYYSDQYAEVVPKGATFVGRVHEKRLTNLYHGGETITIYQMKPGTDGSEPSDWVEKGSDGYIERL